MKPRSEILMVDLCEEIDHWKSEAEYWKGQYESEVKESNRHLTERMAEAQKGIGQMLSLALSVTDNPDGSLSISKENRLTLAESFKSE